MIAANHNKPAILADVAQLSWLVVAGGAGPYLKIENDFAVPTPPVENWPVIVEPESVLETPVSSYDAIIVGALGFMDGGCEYNSLLQGYGVLPEFRPKDDFAQGEFISDRCTKDLIRSVWLRGHEGFKIIKDLRQTFSGQIFVQPYPRLSSEMQEQETWRLRTYYHDYLAAHDYFCDLQVELLRELSEEMSFHLLDYPEEAMDPENRNFTSREYMQPCMLHGTPQYGEFQLKEFSQRLMQLG
ncbi:hypothetical protein ACTL6U_07910 [Rhodovibrionaceae bacterium A322]